MTPDEHWMQHALALADKAEQQGEVPIGAVLVLDEQIIGEGWNQPISRHDPTAHAEIQAIRAACQHTNNYRLPGSTLYVTLEPCIMCAGAIIHSRIKRVVYAASEPKTGAASSCFHIFDEAKLNHRVDITSGVLAEQGSQQLKRFFKAKR